MSDDTSIIDIGTVAGTPAVGPGRMPDKERKAPWWLWTAALLVLAPVTVTIVALFLRALGASSTVWETLLSLRTLQLAGRSFLLTALVTVSAVAIGVAGSWILTRTDIRRKGLWGVAFSLPLVIPSYVIAMTLISSGGPRGIFADMTGIPLPHIRGLIGAWITLTLSTYPYVFLITSAAMHRTDPALEEAARGLGSNAGRTFRTIVLPQLRPAIGASALLVALYTLSDFGSVSLMRLDVFTRAIYAQYSGRLDRTPAIVLSIVLMVIAGIVIWSEQRARGREALFSSKPTRPPAIHRMSRSQRAGATGFLASVIGLGAALPVAVLVGWAAQGVATGDGLFLSWSAITGSLSGAALAALLAMAAAVPIVVLSVRYRSRKTVWLERSVLFVFSLPHLTIAIAVVAFTVRYTRPVYQSLLVLVVVYAAIFLAQVTGPARASLLQIDPTLGDASRSLGHGTFGTMMRVTVPMISKGLLAGGALVFVTTLKELPVTLLLAPTGFTTLAVRIWAAADELLYARAASSALLLIAISVVPIYYLTIRPKEAISS
ncbi:MAG: iron ABC transporter permease [Actinomycetota bacterium]